MSAENTGADPVVVLTRAGPPGSTIVPEESAVRVSVTVEPPLEKFADELKSVHDPLSYL